MVATDLPSLLPYFNYTITIATTVSTITSPGLPSPPSQPLHCRHPRHHPSLLRVASADPSHPTERSSESICKVWVAKWGWESKEAGTSVRVK